jgi:hypothetical protein
MSAKVVRANAMKANVVSAKYCKSQSGERQYYERQSCERQNIVFKSKLCYAVENSMISAELNITYCACCYTTVIMLIKVIISTL